MTTYNVETSTNFTGTIQTNLVTSGLLSFYIYSAVLSIPDLSVSGVGYGGSEETAIINMMSSQNIQGDEIILSSITPS